MKPFVLFLFQNKNFESRPKYIFRSTLSVQNFKFFMAKYLYLLVQPNFSDLFGKYFRSWTLIFWVLFQLPYLVKLGILSQNSQSKTNIQSNYYY